MGVRWKEGSSSVVVGEGVGGVRRRTCLHLFHRVRGGWLRHALVVMVTCWACQEGNPACCRLKTTRVILILRDLAPERKRMAVATSLLSSLRSSNVRQILFYRLEMLLDSRLRNLRFVERKCLEGGCRVGNFFEVRTLRMNDV